MTMKSAVLFRLMMPFITKMMIVWHRQVKQKA